MSCRGHFLSRQEVGNELAVFGSVNLIRIILARTFQLVHAVCQSFEEGSLSRERRSFGCLAGLLLGFKGVMLQSDE